MKIVIHRKICIGSGACATLALKTFRLDSDGKSEVMNGSDFVKTDETTSATVTDKNDTREVLMEAARSCPVNAIQLLEDDGTVIV